MINRLTFGGWLLLMLFCASPLLSQAPDRLPIKCGTPVAMEYILEHGALEGKGFSFFSELGIQARPVLDTSIVSHEGRFRVHYATSGRNAPPSTDLDGNGVPDYIDSVAYYMEFAWGVQVEECHFLAPPADNFLPGIGGPDALLDVYVMDLPNGLYGQALPEAGAVLGENPLRVHGYLQIDNDMPASEYPTPGIDGVRVTTAHELHHLIQFAGYRNAYAQAGLYEATSTWFEYKVHPDLVDYRNYVSALLREPQVYSFSTHNVSDRVTGYAHMLYLVSIVEQTSPEIILDIWEQFRTHPSFTAIDRALRGSGTGLTLESSYCTLGRWSYYTGFRAADTAFLPLAETYPAMVPAQVRRVEAGFETTFLAAMPPLTFGLWRAVLENDQGIATDTVDFVVTNARADIGEGGRHLANDPDGFRLTVSTQAEEGFLPILSDADTVYYRLQADHEHFCVEPILNGSPGLIIAVRPAPQPFISDGSTSMVFNVKVGEEQFERVRLSIYSIDMNLVFDETVKELGSLGQLRGVLWDGRSIDGGLVRSGVYLYRLQIDDEEPLIGKIAVVQRNGE